MEVSIEIPLKRLRIELLQDTTIPLLGIYPKDARTLL